MDTTTMQGAPCEDCGGTGIVHGFPCPGCQGGATPGLACGACGKPVASESPDMCNACVAHCAACSEPVYSFAADPPSWCPHCGAAGDDMLGVPREERSGRTLGVFVVGPTEETRGARAAVSCLVIAESVRHALWLAGRATGTGNLRAKYAGECVPEAHAGVYSQGDETPAGGAL